VFGKGWNW